MSRDSKLTDKDMATLKEADSAKVQSRKTSGVLVDYSLKHRVSMHWDLNEEAKRDTMFLLRVDDYEVMLDWEQVARLGRWI